MRELILYIFLIKGAFCCAQGIDIKLNEADSLNLATGHRLIQVTIINKSTEIFSFPVEPQIGYEDDPGIYLYFSVKKCSDNKLLHFEDSISYINPIIDTTTIKILPHKSYTFNYNLDNLFPLLPGECYEICLGSHLSAKGKNLFKNSNRHIIYR